MPKFVLIDTNSSLVHEDDPVWEQGVERTDGKRRNHVQTIRFPEQLIATRDALTGNKYGYRRCEVSKANAER